MVLCGSRVKDTLIPAAAGSCSGWRPGPRSDRRSRWERSVRSGMTLGQRVEGQAVAGIIEGGHQHQAVEDVEIGVAGGQAVAAKDHRRGHGQMRRRAARFLLVGRGAKALEIFAQRLVVGVVAVGLDRRRPPCRAPRSARCRQRGRGCRRRQCRAPARGPLRSQEIGAARLPVRRGSCPGLRCCVSLSRHSSVVSSSPRPLTSMLPPSSTTATLGFAVTRAAYSGSNTGSFSKPRDSLRKLVVELPVAILGPGVEAPIGDGQLAARDRRTKMRTGVARPAAIGGPAMEAQIAPAASRRSRWRRRARRARRLRRFVLTMISTRPARARWRTISA